MQQRWWIAVVAAVGVGLAVVLFWPPSRGDSVAIEPSTDQAAEGQAVNGIKAVNPRAVGIARPPSAPPGVNTTTPSDLAQLAKRAKPESIYASKLVSPFSAIRYSLARQNTKEANDLIAELGTTMTDLRDMRNEPDKIPWSELQAKTDAAIAKVQSSPWGGDETIAKAIERYKSYLSEYEVAKAAQAQQPAPQEAP